MVVNKFNAVRIPPLGPSLYLDLVSPDLLLLYVYGVKEDKLLHDLFVIYRISNIDVGAIWHMCDCRVEIENIWRRILRM